MLFDRIKINPSYEFLGRAATRSVVSALNFSIANLVANDIRTSLRGLPVDDPEKPLDSGEHVPGTGVDGFNEANAQEDEEREAARNRAEQGYAVEVPPLQLAGMLKVVRDHLAEDLDNHARMMKNPLDPKKGLYKDPYQVAPSLSESLHRQMQLQPKISEAHVRAQADALNLDFEDCLRVAKSQQESNLRFFKDNQVEILQSLHNLSVFDSEGNPYGTANAEEVFEKLPAIQRARMYVAADRGLFYERDRAIGMMMRRHPDGPANIGLIDGLRREIHEDFNEFMRRDSVRREISESVERGANWPVLIDLPKKAVAASAV